MGGFTIMPRVPEARRPKPEARAVCPEDARRRAMPVMNTIELEGVSSTSWGDAAREALREAAKTIRGINKLEVVSTGTDVADGKIVAYRTQVRVYFTVEPSR
jgi:flavin-binding protein dodecin